MRSVWYKHHPDSARGNPGRVVVEVEGDEGTGV